jgi:single-strand DNA-binding protein
MKQKEEEMNNLNSVLLEGNLTKDPESTVTKGWTTLCTFSIGVNRQYKVADEKKEEVSFFEIQTWGKLAENCFEYLSKGRGVRVVGRLKQSRWESDGKSHSKVLVVADQVEFKPASSTQQESSEEMHHV